MGLKGLHRYARDHNVYEDVKVVTELQRRKTSILFVDFCCVFFSMLQNIVAEQLLEAYLTAGDQPGQEVIINLVQPFVNHVTHQLNILRQAVLDQGGRPMHICLVIDGEALPAKAPTHAIRRTHQSNAFHAATKYHNHPRRKGKKHFSFRKAARNWISFSPVIKNAIRYILEQQGCGTYQQTFLNAPTSQQRPAMSYHTALFEADPEVVFLSEHVSPDDVPAILSQDGDLFGFHGAIDVMRIVKIQWNNQANFHGQITTKRDFFNELGLVSNNQALLTQSEVRFACLAATCGNDYAENIKFISFARIAKVLNEIQYQAQVVPAHEFLETLLVKLSSTVTWYQRLRFRVAVHQFCTPRVSHIIPGLENGFHIGIPILRADDMLYYLGLHGAPNPLATPLQPLQPPPPPPPPPPQQPAVHIQGPIYKTIPPTTEGNLPALHDSLAQERWDGEAGAAGDGDDNQPGSGGGPMRGITKAYNKAKDKMKGVIPKSYDPERPTKKIKSRGQLGQTGQTASSSKAAKQKSKTTKSSVTPPDDRLNLDVMPTTIKFKVYDHEQNKHVPMAFHQKSRKVSTMQAGLYSSVLAAAKFWNDIHRQSLPEASRYPEQQTNAYAIAEAELWQGVISSVAKEMSYARYVALHILNIAQRIAFYSLDGETALAFFGAFFTSDTALLQSLWRFILYCGMDYRPLRHGATQTEIRQAEQYAYNDRIITIAMDGELEQGANIHDLKAFNGDVAYVHLAKLMKANIVFRNIFLLARKIWYQDCSQEMIQRAPPSQHRSQLLDLIVTNLINVYQLNVVRNFPMRYHRYIERLLKEQARVPIGWPTDDAFIQQIVDQVNHGGNTNFIDDFEFATDGAREAARQHMQKLIDRRRNSEPHSQDYHFNIEKCTQELISIATIPENWPGPKDALIGYLFYRIWGVTLRSLEDAEDEAEEEQQFQQRVEQLPGHIRDAIDHFVQERRQDQVIGYTVEEAPIHELLGIATQPQEQETQEGALYTATILQHADEGKENEQANQELEDEDDYVGDVNGCTEDTGWLVAMMIHMLESCPEGLSYPISPLAAQHTIAIPFTAGAICDIIKHMEHFTAPIIDPWSAIADDNTKNDEERDYARERAQSLLAARYRIQDRARKESLSPSLLPPAHGFQAFTRQIGRVFNPNRPQPSNEQDIPQRYIHGLSDAQSWDGAIDTIFDIRWRGQVVNVDGEDRVWRLKRTGYARMLRRRFYMDDNKPRYTSRRLFLSDGIRIRQNWNDWNTGARVSQTPRYLKEIRRTSREDLQVAHGVGEADDLLQYFSGVTGLDIGEVCAAASVFLPSDPNQNGSQLIIKRGFLYGRVIPNQQWLERRKNSRNIHDLEDALSEGSARSTFAKLTVYLTALKTDDGAIRLFDFYSSPSVRRRLWDNHLAQRSAMDRACHLVMQQGARTSHGNTNLPVIYAFGLDGLSKRARKGALAPMDHKFSRHLYQRLKQGVHPSSITRIDEYLSSKTCCNCSSHGVESRVQYLQHPATAYAPQRQSYRVVICNTCNRRLHRDGNAAHNLALDTWCYLKWRRRVGFRIRPSRRIQAT